MVLEEINTYIEDDWDDNALTNRTGPTEGYFLHPSDSLIASGDVEAGTALKGVYRPEWNIESGSPSVTSGTLTLSDGSTTNQQVSTPTQFTYGSWETFVNTGSMSSGSFQTWIMSDGTISNIIYFEANHTGNYNLKKGDSGTYTIIISSSYSVGSQFTWKVTYTTVSTYELFKDGVSQGTVSDSFIPTPLVDLHIRNQSDVSVEVDNLVVQ